MLAGIVIIGILTGFLSLLGGMVLNVGLVLAALGYVAGGLFGCLACAGLIAFRHEPGIA